MFTMEGMSIENEPSPLISRLTELNQKGFSKADMARAASVSKQAVSGWFKSGTISKDSALAVASAAGVSVAWLFGEGVDEGTGLNPSELEMLQLFRQLPEDEQRRMIDLFKIRLKEIDDYVERYLRGRYKPSSE